MRLVLGALLGAASGVLGYWIIGLLSIETRAPPVVVEATKLKLVRARGRVTGRGVEIRSIGRLGTAAVIGTLPGLDAEQYQSITWDATGLRNARAVRLVWRTAEDPRRTRTRLLTPEELRSSRAELSEEPGWEGQVLGVGVLIAGPLSSEIRVRSLGLTAKPRGLFDSVAALAHRWGYFEPWSARSINYYAGSPPGVQLTPVAMVVVWIGLSLAIYRLLGGTFVGWQGRSAVVLMVLAGWFALDLRWQWILQDRLAVTMARYAGVGEFSGVSRADRILSESEDALVLAAKEMRRRLPDVPSRLFILSSDPGGFVSGRLRYLLAPHRGYLRNLQLPSRNEIHAGDYVLLLPPLDTIRYERAERVLRSKTRSLVADLVYESRFGHLFLVRNRRR